MLSGIFWLCRWVSAVMVLVSGCVYRYDEKMWVMVVVVLSSWLLGILVVEVNVCW